VLSFKDSGGFVVPGVVKELTESTIIVDFNHPLAGKVILFKAQVVSVMAADVEAVEIKL
jgi:FKBP-type peptidyl-prolyl cis-trans isomerase SlpA